MIAFGDLFLLSSDMLEYFFFFINNGEVQGIPQVIIPLYSVTRNKFKQDFLNGKRNLTIVFDH